MRLYPDQLVFVEQIREAFRTHQSVCATAPTGFGKTQVAAFVAKHAAAKGNRVYFTTHRRGLTSQAQRTFDAWGISYGIIASGVTPTPRALVQIVAIETLRRRLSKITAHCDLMVVDECFRGDVEVLTEIGFVRFDALIEGLRVAQYRDGYVDFVLPTHLIARPHDGPMIHLYAANLCDLRLTPHHELLLARKSGNIVKLPVSSAKFNSLTEMFVAGRASASSASTLTPTEQLLIAYQADGNEHRATSAHVMMAFSFVKERKIDRLHEIVRDGGFTIHEVADNNTKRRRFMVRGPTSATKNLWNHFDLTAISAAKAAAIIEEMVLWDGHIDARGARAAYYSSVQAPQTDFYQCVAILAGYKTNQTVQVDNRSESFSDVHRLFIVKDRATINTQQLRRSEERFAGTVYCVTVPSGNIIVRGNGKPLVVGNCHLAASPTWSQVIRHYRQTGTRLLGTSASPARLDGKPLSEHFDTLVIGPSVRTLINAGRLSDYRLFAPSAPNMDGVRTRRGEYVVGDLETVMSKAIVGDSLIHYKRLMPGRRALAFCVSIKHSQMVAEQFCAGDVPAAHIDGTTPDAERRRIIAAFADGRIHVLCSCQMLIEGFDLAAQVGREVPVEGAIMLRPTASMVLWIQMLGRAMRRKAEPAIILDHTSNAMRLSCLPDDEHEWSLEGTKKAGTVATPAVLRLCTSCFATYRPFLRQCPVCGLEHVTEPRLPEEIEGELKELDLERIRMTRKREEGAAKTLDDLVTLAKKRGYKSGWVAYRWAARTGAPITRVLSDVRRLWQGNAHINGS